MLRQHFLGIALRSNVHVNRLSGRGQRLCSSDRYHRENPPLVFELLEANKKADAKALIGQTTSKPVLEQRDIRDSWYE